MEQLDKVTTSVQDVASASSSVVQDPSADLPVQEPSADLRVQEPSADLPVQEPSAAAAEDREQSWWWLPSIGTWMLPLWATAKSNDEVMPYPKQLLWRCFSSAQEGNRVCMADFRQ